MNHVATLKANGHELCHSLMTSRNTMKHDRTLKVLLVNFNAMVLGGGGGHGGGSGHNGGAMQSLFREAAMHDAIVFFDECESLFAQRGHGGNAQLTELLTEIERYDGMIFLATNRPFDLDEAMHRRITASFEFRSPHWLDRREIWKLHAAQDCTIAEDVDWQEVALRYELAGGFIKNAMHSALLAAVAREGPENPVIAQADIEEGCALQMRGSLKMKSFRHRVVPTAGLDELVLSDLVWCLHPPSPHPHFGFCCQDSWCVPCCPTWHGACLPPLPPRPFGACVKTVGACCPTRYCTFELFWLKPFWLEVWVEEHACNSIKLLGLLPTAAG
jgi:hypothetical protein